MEAERVLELEVRKFIAALQKRGLKRGIVGVAPEDVLGMKYALKTLDENSRRHSIPPAPSGLSGPKRVRSRS